MNILKSTKKKKKGSKGDVMENVINNFIEQLKLEFNFENEFIGFEYEEDGEYYRIWHTYEELQRNKENRKIVSSLLREIMTEEERKNVVVTYSYIKEKELKKIIYDEVKVSKEDIIKLEVPYKTSKSLIFVVNTKSHFDKQIYAGNSQFEINKFGSLGA